MEPKMPVTKTDFPTGNITMIVPSSPGGGIDLQTRVLEKLFPKYLNKALVITNKPGAGGMIGWNELVKSQPNGYTLGMTTIELIIQSMADSKYHYPTALDPIAQITSTPFILVVNADQPWNTLDELIQYAKENPTKFKFGHAGIGSIDHMLGETLAQKINVSFEQVPFQGGSPVLAALLGNHVQAAICHPAVVKEQLNAGRVKALAMTGEERIVDRDLAQIPTFKELGYDEMTIILWTGVAVPQGVPKLVKEKLSVALQNMANDPDFVDTIKKLGLQVDYKNSEDSKQQWVKDIEKLTKMLKETGIAEQIKEQKK